MQNVSLLYVNSSFEVIRSNLSAYNVPNLYVVVTVKRLFEPFWLAQRDNFLLSVPMKINPAHLILAIWKVYF